MTKWQILVLILFIIFGLFVRLYKLNSPIADWHSFRQADTASVTNNFVKNGINLFVPQYHDLSNVQSGLDNPHGYRMVEVPIYNLITTYFHHLFKTNIDLSSRLVSIIFSLGSSLLIFLICYRLTNTYLPSLFSLVVFLLLPFNIYYSRTILPEPAAVFFMLLSLYLFPKNLILSAVSLSLSILLKPYTILIILPTLLLHSFQKYAKSFNRKNLILFIIFTLITILPFYFWRRWIGNFPEGIPKSDWLLNNNNTTTFPNWYRGYDLTFLNKMVAFRPHWFNWLFKERLANLILGTFGIIPLFLGLAYKKNKTQTFAWSLVVGILIYFIIIAQGNIQHDYYQILIIPSISILVGYGLFFIYKFLFSKPTIGFLLITSISLISIYLSWYQVKGYYQINHPQIITAGIAAKKLLPLNSLVVAPYTGDTALLYQTGFNGWPIEIYDIDNIISKHYPNPIYLVSVNFDHYTNSLISKYPIIEKNSDFVILRLSP